MRVYSIATGYKPDNLQINFKQLPELPYVEKRTLTPKQRKQLKVTTIGGATEDIFVKTPQKAFIFDKFLTNAEKAQLNTPHNHQKFIGFPYGEKLESAFTRDLGGGALNTALNFNNLGFYTSIVTKVGDDLPGKKIEQTLRDVGIDTNNNISVSKDYGTASSVILVGDDGNRTVLADRGAGGNIRPENINFTTIKNSDWLYIAPMNGNSAEVLDEVAEFAQDNGVDTAINIGTSSIKKGSEYLNKVLSTAEIIILNAEEAAMLTRYTITTPRDEDPPSEVAVKKQLRIHDIKEMLYKIREKDAKGSRVIIITDGSEGAYAFTGKKYYECPVFPAKAKSTLGAGDAFASTFVGALMQTDWDIEKSLQYATLNSAAVVEHAGANEGFLTFEEMDKKLARHPDFQVKISQVIGIGSKN